MPIHRTTQALGIVDALCGRLDRDGVRYCHWKSNEHLADALAGITDLDLLVDRRAAGKLAIALAELDCKRFTVAPGRRYPGIEDYVAFDEASGTLLHLHIHYQLTVGERLLKSYRLPWEERVLATRVRAEGHPIYVADPGLEAVLLLVRATMKVRARDLVLTLAGRPVIGGKVLRELRWLRDRVPLERLTEIARPLVGARAAALLPAMLTAPRPTTRQVLSLRRLLEPPLRSYRAYAAFEAALRGWVREVRTAATIALSYLRPGGRVSSRTSPLGGTLIAVQGDGSVDPSVLARDLATWLGGEAHTVRARHWAAARQARDRGLVAVVAGPPPPGIVPDVTIRLTSDAHPQGAGVLSATQPAHSLLLEAKRAVWRLF